MRCWQSFTNCFACLMVLLGVGLQVQAAPDKSKDISKDAGKQPIDTSIGQHQYGYHLRFILQAIQATPIQSEEISSIVEACRPRIEPMRKEYREKSDEFLSFIISGKPDDVVMSRQSELNQIHNSIVGEYVVMQLKIRRLLSPAQWEQMQKYDQQQGWSSPK